MKPAKNRKEKCFTPPLDLPLREGETPGWFPSPLKRGLGVGAPSSLRRGLGGGVSKANFALILPNIRSGHNVGAMFRTADGAGVDKIYLTGYTPRPPHKEILKVSLGAEKTVLWEEHKHTAPFLKKLKKQGFRLVALEQTRQSVNIFSWRPRFPLALLVGNEVMGLPPNILKLCDNIVDIPMRGEKSSLNVSVAAGVAMYYIASRISL